MGRWYMNIGEVIDRLTINQETVQEFYNGGYGQSEFKVKDTSVFTEDVVKYFNEEIHSGKSLGWIKTEDKFKDVNLQKIKQILHNMCFYHIVIYLNINSYI